MIFGYFCSVVLGSYNLDVFCSRANGIFSVGAWWSFQHLQAFSLSKASSPSPNVRYKTVQTPLIAPELTWCKWTTITMSFPPKEQKNTCSHNAITLSHYDASALSQLKRLLHRRWGSLLLPLANPSLFNELNLKRYIYVTTFIMAYSRCFSMFWCLRLHKSLVWFTLLKKCVFRNCIARDLSALNL